jgi:hypothetical protein
MAHDPWKAMGYVSAPEPTTEVGAVQSQRMCVSVGSHLSGEAGSGAEGRMVVMDPSWMVRGVLSLWACGSAGALLDGGRGPEAWTCGSTGALPK